MTYEVTATLERKGDLNHSENKRGVVKNYALVILLLDKGGLEKKVGAKRFKRLLNYVFALTLLCFLPEFYLQNSFCLSLVTVVKLPLLT